MNYEEISELLNRYFDGETSLEEERKLKAAFASGRLADERLQKFRPLFEALRLDAELEISGAEIVPAAPRMRIVHRNIFRFAAAASVTGSLAFGAWWYRQNPVPALAATPDPQLFEDTFQSPEEAAAEIKAALALVSSKMRKGKREAAKGLKKVKAVDKFIIKPKRSKPSTSNN